MSHTLKQIKDNIQNPRIGELRVGDKVTLLNWEPVEITSITDYEIRYSSGYVIKAMPRSKFYQNIRKKPKKAELKKPQIKTSDSFLIKRNGQVCKLSYFKKEKVYVIYVDGLFQSSIRTEAEFDCFLNSLQIVDKVE